MPVRRILVTGGAGFVGSHTCKALAAEGFEPVTLDNLSTGNERAVRWGPFVQGDVADGELVAETIGSFGIDAVVHLAASTNVGESVARPGAYYRNNVTGMIALLTACCGAGIDTFVFSSSCAVYGHPDTIPITEECARRPINTYGRTKLIGEQMLADFGQATGLKHASLRYFNASGADPDGEIGEWHEPETHLIPLALMVAAGTKPVLELFGSDHETPDGTCIRDYVHVWDIARAHVLALDYLSSGEKNLTVNLGTGTGISVREIIRAVSRITGRDIAVSDEPARPGDPPILVADAARARNELGFSAQLSDIDTIVKTAAPFFGVNAGQA